MSRRWKNFGLRFRATEREDIKAPESMDAAANQINAKTTGEFRRVAHGMEKILEPILTLVHFRSGNAEAAGESPPLGMPREARVLKPRKASAHCFALWPMPSR